MSLEEELANPSTDECLRIINNRLQQENARLRECLNYIVNGSMDLDVIKHSATELLESS